MSLLGENDLRQLARIHRIDPDTWDYASKLGKVLGHSSTKINRWKKRGIPEWMQRKLEREYPGYTWSWQEKPPEEPKIVSAPEAPVYEAMSEPDRDLVHKMVQIALGEEARTAAALRANIEQFYEKLQDKREVRALKERVQHLEQQMEEGFQRLEQLIKGILDQHQPPLGVEERRQGFIALREEIEKPKKEGGDSGPKGE